MRTPMLAAFFGNSYRCSVRTPVVQMFSGNSCRCPIRTPIRLCSRYSVGTPRGALQELLHYGCSVGIPTGFLCEPPYHRCSMGTPTGALESMGTPVMGAFFGDSYRCFFAATHEFAGGSHGLFVEVNFKLLPRRIAEAVYGIPKEIPSDFV